MNFIDFFQMPNFKTQYFNSDRKITRPYHTPSQSQKHSTVTSQTQISVIQSHNQQQRVVPIQRMFQHSSQPECSPQFNHTTYQ